MKYTYKPLWESLKQRGISTYQLIQNSVISSSTVERLKKDENVTIETMMALIEFCDIEPNEIFKVVDDDYVPRSYSEIKNAD